MKKTLSIFLIALIVFSSLPLPLNLLCNAQASIINSTVITSDTTWTRAASPYNLTGPIAVSKGVTLRIEAGTTIILNKYYIQVNGTFIAVGSKSSPINIIGGLGGRLLLHLKALIGITHLKLDAHLNMRILIPCLINMAILWVQRK